MAKFLVFIFCVVASFQAMAADHLPVVFAPGLGSTGDHYRNHTPLIELFKAQGYTLIIADTVEYGSIETRANSLIASINAQLPAGRFHLVAHSMGGIDARLAIAQGAFGSRVASLTTISTPHHGTSAAAYVLKLMQKQHLKLKAALMDGIRDMTVESMTAFNAQYPQDPSVPTFSIGCYLPHGLTIFETLNPLILIGHHVIAKAGEGDNDGIVSTSSALWGTSLGNIPADHFTEADHSRFDGGYPILEIIPRVIENLDRL